MGGRVPTQPQKGANRRHRTLRRGVRHNHSGRHLARRRVEFSHKELDMDFRDNQSYKSRVVTMFKDYYNSDRMESEVTNIVTELINLILRVEMEDLIGAADYERGKDRLNSRNGYRCRSLRTVLGMVTVQIPRLRKGSFKSKLFYRFKDNELMIYNLVKAICANSSVKRSQAKKLYTSLTQKDITKKTLTSFMEELDAICERVQALRKEERQKRTA